MPNQPGASPLLSFLNPTRLRVYPRLFFAISWAILLFNGLLGSGWQGANGQVIGNDFLAFYAAGLQYRAAPDTLYDWDALGAIEAELVAPAPLWGVILYSNPPYVAPVYAWLTVLPYPWAFALWTLGNIALSLLAAWWMGRSLVPGWLRQAGLTWPQLWLILAGSYAFVEALQVGQNHGLTLLLLAGAAICTLERKDWAAGLLLGLALYKPQFAFAFGVLWLAWGRWRSIGGLAAVGAAWVGWSLLVQGLAPYWRYLELLPTLVKLHLQSAAGHYLEVNIFSLLASLIGHQHWQVISNLVLALNLLSLLALLLYAWKLRRAEPLQRIPALIFAILYPLIFTPHQLLHDALILVPALLLWAAYAQKYGGLKPLLLAACAIYLAALFLPYINYAIGLPLLALIPAGLALALGIQAARQAG